MTDLLLVPDQVRIPQGGGGRQGRGGLQEGAAGADLWPLDRHGHRPYPRDARRGRHPP